MNKAIGVLVFIALAGIVAGLIYTQRPLPDQPEPLVELPPPAEETGPQYPVPEVAAPPSEEEEPVEPEEPLPALDASDPLALENLLAVIGEQSVRAFLRQEDIVRRTVVTIDNLPRGKVAVEKRPVQPTPGRFLATGDDDSGVLSPENFTRYAPLVRLIEVVNIEQLAGIYLRLYPLFQEAYEGLGYPDEHFNDRLVAVIDHMLAAPEIAGPIRLVRPKVFYEFSDPDLEALSAGHKLLIRMGPDHTAVIQTKLRQLRDLVTVAE